MNRYFTIFALAVASVLPAAAQPIHPITQAMLDGYEELLRQNPDDWFTLYERASQYYRLSDYDKALADILHAISCTPAKEKEQLAAAHSLAADIYLQREDYEQALAQIDDALLSQPGAYSYLYQKGNICLHLNRVADARKSFQAMMRLKSRSQEALFGLAKCALADGDEGEARTYMQEAEKMDPTNYITFCRLGDLYTDMGEVQNAAAAYLSAFSLGSRDDRPLSSLLALGHRDYAAVAEALDYAMSKTSNTVPLLFLKGNIAKETGHVKDARESYSRLVNTPQGGSPEVLVTMAEICRDANSLNEALGYADRAFSLAPSPRTGLLKASMLFDLGDYAAASKICDSILSSEPDNCDALLLGAECAMSQGEDAVASDVLSRLLAADPLSIRGLLLAGYHASRSDSSDAQGYYSRAARLSASDDTEAVYKAVAQLLSGKSLDAYDSMGPVLSKAESDGQAAYLAALFYADTDNIAKGKEMLAKARKNGFDNLYLLETYSVPMLSIAPLR